MGVFVTAKELRTLADRCWAERTNVSRGSSVDHLLMTATDAFHDLARKREKLDRAQLLKKSRKIIKN